jgi:hypothetical protein
VVELRRKGALPPIITVLIILGSLVATGLVVWFMFTTTRSATSQPILDVADAYYVSGSIFFTARNIGPVDVAISRINVTCQSGGTASYSPPTPTQIPKGASQSISASASGTIDDGDLCVAQVTLSSPSTTSLTLSFRVVKP